MSAVSLRPNYRRAAATREVSLFVGWDYLLDLVEQVDGLLKRLSERYEEWRSRYEEAKSSASPFIHVGRPPRKVVYSVENVKMHKAAISVFFLTGGRAREILGTDRTPPLKPTQFRLDLDPDYIYIERMPVLKRYRKLDFEVLELDEMPYVPPAHRHLWHYDRKTGKFVRKVYRTIRLSETRTFYFRRDEPLVPYLLDWLEIALSRNMDRLLEGDYGYWYWFLRQLDPMREKYGARVSWRWIYPHWFRAQRASQLAVDYGLDLHEIADWGSWKSLEVVREYVGTASSIKKKMGEAKPSWLSPRGAWGSECSRGKV
ncbi:MAG: hypothetical protein QXT28_06960 [Thermofilaceae archaeon]